MYSRIKRAARSQRAAGGDINFKAVFGKAAIGAGTGAITGAVAGSGAGFIATAAVGANYGAIGAGLNVAVDGCHGQTKCRRWCCR